MRPHTPLPKKRKRRSGRILNESNPIIPVTDDARDPEEQEIKDMDDEDEASTIDEVFVISQPVIDETPKRRKNHRRSRSVINFQKITKKKENLSFDENRDQFERLWQLSQTDENFFQNSQSVKFDPDTHEINSGTLPHLINKLADHTSQGNLS